jgi:broad specificity phosphatase PhoE
MSIYLTFISHGATSATRAAAFPQDEPVESRAVSNAAGLVDRLGRTDRAWTSPALRARQTAAALSLNPIVNPSLRDCDYGSWAGRTLADVQAEEPAKVAVWLSDAKAAPHGGEALFDLFQRIAAWMNERIGEKGRAIAVTHVAVIRAALLHVLQAPASSFWRIDIEPLSMVQLRGDGTKWTLLLTEKLR